MLRAYRNTYEKLAMGLLSFIPKFKKMPDLEAEMAKIKAGERELYLYKPEDSENFIGIIGFDLVKERHNLILRYVSLLPSFRGEGLVFVMLDELAQTYRDYTFSSAVEMASFLRSWSQRSQNLAYEKNDALVRVEDVLDD